MELKYKIDRHNSQPHHAMLLSFLHILFLLFYFFLPYTIRMPYRVQQFCIETEMVQQFVFFFTFFSLLILLKIIIMNEKERGNEREIQRDQSIKRQNVDVVLFSTSGWLFSAISSKGPLTHLLTLSFVVLEQKVILI